MKVRSFFIAGVVSLFLLSIPLILPFFEKGYFTTHDGEWAVVRLADMYREVKDGQIPPRFSGNLNTGYGYPLFQYAYPLPYYVGLPLYLSHIGLVNSVKLLFASTVFLSGISMFFLSRKIWKSNVAGVISGILYMYAPYRLVDLYVRGSLGESIASVFFPLILFLMVLLRERPSFFKILLLSCGVAGLILTHNIMAVLFFIIMLGFITYLFFEKNIRSVKAVVIGVCGGFFLSAYFWVPALLEKKFVLLSIIPIADRNLHYVSLKQLLLPSWGYGTPTDPDAFTYQLGVAHVVLTIFALVLAVRKRKDENRNFTFLLSGLILLFLLLMFPFSKIIWENAPLLHEINYPWTCLLPLVFLCSVLSGKVALVKSLFQKVIVGIVLIVTILFGISYAKPDKIVDHGDGFYFTNDATTTSSKELMPLWVKEFPTVRPKNKIEIIKGRGNISSTVYSSHKASFIADLDTDAVIRFNTIYFPNWTWIENEKKISYTYNNPIGVMDAKLSKGYHSIFISLKDTSVRSVSNLISLVAITFIGFAFFIRLIHVFWKRKITFLSVIYE